MHPTLFTLELPFAEHPVRSYGVMLSLGSLVASLLVVRASVRARLDSGAVIAVVAITVLAALVGADVAFVIVEWIRTGSPTHALTHGGLVFYGAFVFGIVAVFIAGPRLRVDPWKLGDLGAPALAAGHAIGRLGCFFGGCCFGGPTDAPWAVTYTDASAPGAYPSVPRHPTPLYEAVALTLLAIVLALIPQRRIGSGHRLTAYVVGYACIRFLLERTRGDSIRGVFGPFSTSQLIALVVIGVMTIALANHRRLRASEAG